MGYWPRFQRCRPSTRITTWALARLDLGGVATGPDGSLTARSRLTRANWPERAGQGTPARPSAALDLSPSTLAWQKPLLHGPTCRRLFNPEIATCRDRYMVVLDSSREEAAIQNSMNLNYFNISGNIVTILGNTVNNAMPITLRPSTSHADAKIVFSGISGTAAFNANNM